MLSLRKLVLFSAVFLLAIFLLNNFGVPGLSPVVLADGTKTWEQSKFEELIKGTPAGVSIRSAGGLELAPAFKMLYSTPSTYIWALSADDSGNLYAATGAPARVYRITPDGKATIIFEPQELQVQAIEVGPGGVIYAGTAPDGKVYKIEHKPGNRNEAKPDPAAEKKSAGEKSDTAKVDSAKSDVPKPALDPSWSSTVLFAPQTKYIWDLALDKGGNLYVATGDHGEIYKVTAKGDHSLFFKSDETHIRVLTLDAQGNVIAGSDGSGLVYRISPAGEGFVLYSAPKKEITALALDQAGNIYAAGVGEKRAGTSSSGSGVAASMLTMSTSAPTSPGTQTPGLTITMPNTPPATGPFPFPGGGASGGSDIYRISTDGSPLRVWTSHDDIVYALAFDANHLLAGTGNRGHIFAINGPDEFADLLKAPVSQVTAFAKAPGGALYASSSNLGKIFVLGAGLESEGTYESDVLDAKIFSRWGRAEFRGTGNVELFARSGNVDNPDRNWSAWKKVELNKDSETGIPSARYAQWKAVLHADGARPLLESVTLNYLPKNVAPEIDDVSVQMGTRYSTMPRIAALSSSPDVSGSSGSHFEAPIPSTHDRDSIGVKWSAHDENDDQMVYSVYYRGDGESRWLLLKDNLSDKAYSFDASLLPDGGYTVKVVASDAPSHSPGEALTAEKESRRFEVDTTPPRVENLAATVEGEQIRIHFRGEDAFLPIKRAEYSVDAGEWKYVEPVGQLSDAKTEDYDFKVSLDKIGSNKTDNAPKDAMTSEHVVVVRVYDRYDNMGAAKVVIHGK